LGGGITGVGAVRVCGSAGSQRLSSALLLDADVTGYTGRAGGRAAVTSRGARFLDVGGALMDGDDLPQERSRPPRLVSAAAIAVMRPRSVIVDIAAGRYGGNVIGTTPGTTVTVPPGVRLIGAENLPSRAPGLASEYYADNVVMALRRLCATGEPLVALSDPVWSATVLGHSGQPDWPTPATLSAPTTGNPPPARSSNGRFRSGSGVGMTSCGRHTVSDAMRGRAVRRYLPGRTVPTVGCIGRLTRRRLDSGNRIDPDEPSPRPRSSSWNR
jgi:hypothetical protein